MVVLREGKFWLSCVIEKFGFSHTLLPLARP